MTAVVSYVDEEIRSEVQDEIAWDSKIGPNTIGVAVKGGVATLSGGVNSYAAKVAAAEAAHRVRGVEAVANDITVHIPSFAERTDPDIAQAVLNSLQWNAWVPTNQLEVTVSQGVVTLKGTVDWLYQRRAAEDAISHLAGVRAVMNETRVAPQVQPKDLQQRLEHALQRSATVEASGITIETKGTGVTLKGKVHSYAERRAAGDAAWLAPGVTAVENLLVVENT